MQSSKDRYHHGNLASALVQAGLALVEAGDIGMLSLREVARRTAVSAAAVYRHFPDKEALLAAIAAEGFAALNVAFDSALAAAPSEVPLARLRALGTAYVDFAQEHPALFRFIFGTNLPAPSSDPRLVEESERAFRVLATLVAACCPPTAEARRVTAATVAAWSLVHGYALLRLEGRLARLPPGEMPDTAEILSSVIPAF